MPVVRLVMPVLALLCFGAAACDGGTREGAAAAPTATPSAEAAAPTSSAAPSGLATPPATSTSPPTLTLVAVGDVMPGRSLGWALESGGAPLLDEPIVAVLSGASLAVANLEAPVATGGEAQAKSYTFRAPPSAASALAGAGFDVVGLANNHILDFGPDALAETTRLLREAGVAHAGAGVDRAAALEPAIVERGGVRIAFVSLVDVPAEGSFSRSAWEAGPNTPGVAWADERTVAEAVVAARASAAIVVALLHFGNEFHAAPSESQRTLARLAIDAGAALVVGTHPHVLQEVEEYHGGLIAYSLGNFLFDGFDGLVEDSAILRVTFTGPLLTGWDLLTVRIDPTGRPHLSTGD